MRGPILCLALLLLVSGSALADRRADSPSEYAVIQNGEGVYRLLFKVDELEGLGESAAISHAELSFDLTGTTAERTVYLSLCPVTTSWSAASVGWDTGWTRPGGDFDRGLSSRATVDLSRGGGRAIFDVTPIVKEWLEQGAEYHGFLLTAQPRDGEGLRGEDVTRLSGLANASLDVRYRTGPRRPSRGAGRS